MLGNIHDAINFNGDTVISVCEDYMAYQEYFKGKTWGYIDIKDNIYEPIMEYIDGLYDFLNEVKNRNGKCMIHCHAGINRSATLAIAYYMKVNNCNLYESYDTFCSMRPGIISNIGFRKKLIKWAFTQDLL